MIRPPSVPDPESGTNVLMLHGTVSGTGVDEQLLRMVEYGGAHLERSALDEEAWDYVALGHYHNATRIASNFWYAGATERTATNIWAEADTRKGWVLYDTETRTGEFRDVKTREVVDLPRFSARRPVAEESGAVVDEWLTAEEIDERIRSAVAELPGGVDGKVVRLVITDMPRELFRELDHGQIRALKAEALHFQLDARRPETRRRAASDEPQRRTLEEEVELFLAELGAVHAGGGPGAAADPWRRVPGRHGGLAGHGAGARPRGGRGRGRRGGRRVRLDRLRLRNFRQHADTEIELRSGVTGIIGPNGAGKSTLLEAIAWAIYGAPAARGTNETIRFARAEPRSPVRVELEFGLAGHDYRVARTLSGADVYVDGDERAVATTIRGASDYLQQRLGMTRDEFFNTYFTGQKELQFLAQMGPTERGRFLAQVLGYERLRLAQERARARRNDLRHEIDGLRAGMSDPVALRAELEGARGRRAEEQKALDAARSVLESARSTLAEVTPRWEAGQASQERAGELEHEREMAAQEFRDASRAVTRAEEELEAVTKAAGTLTVLKDELAPLPALVEECERLSELARLDERRQVLAETVESLRSEVGAGEKRLETLAQAPGYAERFRAEIQGAEGGASGGGVRGGIRAGRLAAGSPGGLDAAPDLQGPHGRAPAAVGPATGGGPGGHVPHVRSAPLRPL